MQWAWVAQFMLNDLKLRSSIEVYLLVENNLKTKDLVFLHFSFWLDHKKSEVLPILANPRYIVPLTDISWTLDSAHLFQLIVLFFTSRNCFHDSFYLSHGNNTVQHISTNANLHPPLSLSTRWSGICLFHGQPKFQLNQSLALRYLHPWALPYPSLYPTSPTPSLDIQTPSHPDPNPPHPSHSNPTQFMWGKKDFYNCATHAYSTARVSTKHYTEYSSNCKTYAQPKQG